MGQEAAPRLLSVRAGSGPSWGRAAAAGAGGVELQDLACCQHWADSADVTDGLAAGAGQWSQAEKTGTCQGVPVS